jgi:hypothetical protein
MDSGWRGIEKYLGRKEKSISLKTVYLVLTFVKRITDSATQMKTGTVALFFPHFSVRIESRIHEYLLLRLSWLSFFI